VELGHEVSIVGHKMALKLPMTTIKKKMDSGFKKKLKSEFICCLVLMSAHI
jgi:hypothetical protein